MATRSRRSEAFEQRQASKAQKARERAEAKGVPAMARHLREYFQGLAGRLEVTTAQALAAAEQAEVKAHPQQTTVKLFNLNVWPSGEDKKLFDLLKQDYVKLSAQAFDDVGSLIANTRGAGNVGSVSAAFSLDARNTKALLGKLAYQVKGINNETRWRLNRVVLNGIKEGLHPHDIAKNIISKTHEQYLGFGGQGITKSRAYTIARTETAHAYTWSSIAAYEKSGIVSKVVCHDAPDCGWIGHNGSELANGTHRTLQEASAHPTSHPNCVRAFSPAFGAEAPDARTRKGPPGKAPKTPAAQNPKDDIWKVQRDFSDLPGQSTYYGGGTHPLEQWSHQLFEGRTGGATQNKFNAAQHYQGFGYRTWNSLKRKDPKSQREVQYLSATEKAQHLQDIKVLEGYIDDMAPIPETVLVHRGMGSGTGLGFDRAMSPAQRASHAQSLVGSTQIEEGFMSTALDARASFSGVRLELIVPKGQKGLPMSNEALGYGGIGDAQKAMSEAELLLNTGTRYVIDKVEVTDLGYGGQQIKVFARVLPR